MADEGAHRSGLRDFMASIATIKGDLTNITAPPFVLADKSTTEFPRFWVQHPEIFCAAAHEQDPAKRTLAILKWFLSALKDQLYAGRDPSEGTKKPLNAFLGEVFQGVCGPQGEETRLVAEQVSHHPPVTACYLWNDQHGIRAEGYTRQELTFSGSVNIQQFGYAIMHIDEFNEDYYIPLPNVKVKGILTGAPYPEIDGNYSIASSSGYIAKVDFSGKSGFLGLSGKKNHLEAAVYGPEDTKQQHPLFSAEGSWTEAFDLKDGGGKVLETYSVAGAQPTEFRTPPLEQQDPWESHRAWQGVIKAIRTGDMQAVADNKSALENAQRELRKKPETSEETWQSLFFKKASGHAEAESLMSKIGVPLDEAKTCGVWRYSAPSNLDRPWRGELTPQG